MLLVAIDHDGQGRTTAAAVLVADHVVGDQARPYLGVDFDVLLVQSELLHVLDGGIVFTQVLWLLLLQFVFGGREVLLRLLHNIIVCSACGGRRLLRLAHRHC